MPSAWSALADPHRREMLTLLLERPRPVGELVERLGLTQPGSSKHLRVLREAGLVQVRKEAQRRGYAPRPRPPARPHARPGAHPPPRGARPPPRPHRPPPPAPAGGGPQ